MMNRFHYDKSDTTLTKILICCIAAVLAIVFMGTIIGLAVKKTPFKKAYRKADPTPQKVINLSAATSTKVAAYTSLGQIRAVTKSPDAKTPGTIVVVAPWFAYPDGDETLVEELSDKSRHEKAIISEYFESYTVKQLHSMGEKKVKEDLLNLINAELALGKISAVYFDSYVFFE